jgi:hypothetical protein
MSATIEQIIKMEHALMQAMLKSNVKALDSLISDDLIFTDHTGRVLNKVTDIESHRSGNLKIELLEPSEQIIKIYNQTAIVSVLMMVSGHYLNEHFQGKIRYSRTWINTDNVWKIVMGHSSSVNS